MCQIEIENFGFIWPQIIASCFRVCLVEYCDRHPEGEAAMLQELRLLVITLIIDFG